MRTNLATRLYSCLFYLLCVIPLWTRPIERIFASSSLHPSLQTSSEASGLEKSSGGVGGLGLVQPSVGGVKGESALGWVSMWGASHNSVFPPADKPDHRGNNRTIIGCAYSCAQRNGANEALTRASANDQIC